MEAISIIVIGLCIISAIQRRKWRKYRSETAKIHPRYEWIHDTKKDECLDCIKSATVHGRELGE